MPRYKITIEYDGTNLLGWQKQLDGPSAQEFLENAIFSFAGKSESKIGAEPISNHHLSTGEVPQVPLSGNKTFFKEENTVSSTERRSAAYMDIREHSSTGEVPQIPLKKGFIEVCGAGRTDAGVHALGQVAHFDLKKTWDLYRLREALNAKLRDDRAPVSVLNVEIVPDSFHARFSAKGRGYIYRILNRPSPTVLEKDRVWWVAFPLDIEKMRQGAEYLLGHHDFSSFRAAACQALSPLKTLDRLDISNQGDEIVFTVEARSFLHHQVRNIVGTLKMIGGGYWPPEKIKDILAAKDRKAAGPTAPAGGLYLNKVMY